MRDEFLVESNRTVQSAQMTQMTQEMQICSKRLKHADGGGADGDFLSETVPF